MIETNKAIDFIGEVTLLANMPKTSVTIEALTANTVTYLPRGKAEQWVNTDIHILRKMAEHTAFKLYRSSYHNGLKLYYPPIFLLADHLVRLYEQESSPRLFTLQKTRERLGEELGMNSDLLPPPNKKSSTG